MLKNGLLLFTLLILIPSFALSETIDVMIKGIDDGVKTNRQQDYNEAVMNAKLQAIERAGVEIQSITQVVNFQTKFDMVESKAKAVLMPGFQIMDIGYQLDGTYIITAIAEDTKEARSDESTFQVIIPRTRATYQQIFLRIFERVIELFPILKNIFGLQ